MKRIAGYLVGLIWVGFVYIAFTTSSGFYAQGADDFGFWWRVIAGLLSIATLGAFIGTTIHSKGRGA